MTFNNSMSVSTTGIYATNRRTRYECYSECYRDLECRAMEEGECDVLSTLPLPLLCSSPSNQTQARERETKARFKTFTIKVKSTNSSHSYSGHTRPICMMSASHYDYSQLSVPASEALKWQWPEWFLAQWRPPCS